MQITFLNSKIIDFVDSLEKHLKPRVTKAFELLEYHGNNLRMPYSRSLGKGLFELRIVGMIHVRFLYTFYRGKIVIVHAFIKKTGSIDFRDIVYARKMIEWLN